MLIKYRFPQVPVGKWSGGENWGSTNNRGGGGGGGHAGKDTVDNWGASYSASAQSRQKYLELIPPEVVNASKPNAPPAAPGPPGFLKEPLIKEVPVHGQKGGSEAVVGRPEVSRKPLPPPGMSYLRLISVL